MEAYLKLKRSGRQLIGEAGWGTDGYAYTLKPYSVIKAHYRNKQHTFANEWLAYRKLRNDGVTGIRGVEVPQLLNVDADRLPLEISYVQPPCLLDFSKARIDQPDFPPEVDQWQEDQIREEFGDVAEEAILINAILIHRHGIHHNDLRPWNLIFKA